jgi:hypothetical protein
MPNGNKYITYNYRLRSAGAIPYTPGTFLVQTFGVDKTKIETYEASTTLPRSDEFMGADPDGEYASANFQRLGYLNEAGQHLFSGNINFKPEYDDNHELEN